MSVLGFKKQKQYFGRVFKNGDFQHAYLLSGPEMLGKKTLILELCEAVHGKMVNDPDLIVLRPKKEENELKIYIDDIRRLKSFMSLKPYQSMHKFAVIDDADCMTPDASNALLKLLEEPPAHSVLFLITSKPRLLLPTIRSRCYEISCTPNRQIKIDEVIGSAKVAKSDAELLESLWQGRPGWVKNVIEENKLPLIRKFIEEFIKLFKSGTFERLEYAKKIYDSENYSEAVTVWFRWLSTRDKSSPVARKALKGLLRLSQIISQPQYNHRLALESFLINL